MKRLLKLAGAIACCIGLHKWQRMDERVSPYCCHKRIVCQRCLAFRYLPEATR